MTAAAPKVRARLARLKAAPRRAGEAAFFFYDTHFGNNAVKVLPGEYFVHDEDVLIMTTLGSCIAACLWDRERRIGGLNHFMLPDGGEAGSGRYGAYAMESLINALLERGASRGAMEAKVFGGSAVIGGTSLNVGQRNTRFALDYLKAERITVVSKDVLGVYARKVCFLPASGKAMVKRLATTHPDAFAELERQAVRRAQSAAGGGAASDLP